MFLYQVLFGTIQMRMALVGGASSSNPSVGDEQREPVEWVEIEIHMPDGRVIKRREQRYPSRSRVFLSTGKLPAFKRGTSERRSGSQVAAGAGDVSEVVEVADVVEDVGAELAVEDGESIEVAESVEDHGGSGAVTTFKKSP